MYSSNNKIVTFSYRDTKLYFIILESCAERKRNFLLKFLLNNKKKVTLQLLYLYRIWLCVQIWHNLLLIMTCLNNDDNQVNFSIVFGDMTLENFHGSIKLDTRTYVCVYMACHVYIVRASFYVISVVGFLLQKQCNATPKMTSYLLLNVCKLCKQVFH